VPGTHPATLGRMRHRSAFALGLVAAAALLLRTVTACTTSNAAGSPDAGVDATATEAGDTSDAGDGGDGGPNVLCNIDVCLCLAIDVCTQFVGCFVAQTAQADGAVSEPFCAGNPVECDPGGRSWSIGTPIPTCGHGVPVTMCRPPGIGPCPLGPPTYVDGAPDGAICCAPEVVDAAISADAGADVDTVAADTGDDSTVE
jgi:hypothetical protein